MSLCSDSVYRVDLDAPSARRSGAEGHQDARNPPRVLQIRLTEQALQQLANACSSSAGDGARIRIDVNPADPLLVIGDTSFPLHAPLPATTPHTRTAAVASDAASTSTAPHELFQLSEDESTLHRIGTIASKLSVKPTRDVSAVAQRLKQQKEEEEHRKQERRKALMQGTSPQLSASSSSSRARINKTLTSVRAASGSPGLASSPLSRSTSLNRLSARRDPSLFHSTSLSRGVSREPSPAARANSPAVPQPKLQGASYDVRPSARRADTAITDSPKTSTASHPHSPTRLQNADHASNSSASSLGIAASRTDHRLAPAEEGAPLPDDDRARRNPQLLSPGSAASEQANAGSKKTTKLTTRQRLAKATKAGSRLLAASERRATPERRTTPTTTHPSPPSKLGTSSALSTQSITAKDQSAVQPQSPPKPRAQDAATSAPLRRNEPERRDRFVEDRNRATAGAERGRRISPTPASSTNPIHDEPATVAKKAAGPMRPQRAGQSKGGASTLASGSRKLAASAEIVPIDANERKEISARVQKDPKRQASSVEASKRKPNLTSAVESPAAVQVVTMRKARPANKDNGAAAKIQPADTSRLPRTTRRSDADPSGRGRTVRADAVSRPDNSTDREATTSRTSPTKQAATRKSDEDPADTMHRKRRRTNDFVPADDSNQHRKSKTSMSPTPDASHADESLPRKSEPSRDGSARQGDPTSPRDGTMRGTLPTSASVPSFVSASNRLQPVPEGSDREPRRPRAAEYHDRRRDRSYDELHYDDLAPQDRSRSSHRDGDDARRQRRAAEDARSSSRGPSSGSSIVKVPSTSVERPIKGVGPGAAHWSEPWLDVRSRADWHRLAQRFARTQEEYFASRKRLEAESERLDRELQLASMEEQEMARTRVSHSASELPAERSLLFSPAQVSTSGTSEWGSKPPHVGTGDQDDVIMRDLDVETALNTSANARTRRNTRARPVAEDGDESPEEGEMRSSDDEEGRTDTHDVRRSDSGTADHRSPGTTSSVDSLLLASRRSESPDNIAWRPSSAKVHAQAVGDLGHSERSTATTGPDGADRPLSYTDLANRVHQLGELYGSLSRMHRVLVDFKAKSQSALAK